MKKIIRAAYFPDQKILELRLSGLLNQDDLRAWQAEIAEAMKQVPSHTSFKALVNLHGFKADNIDTHKAFRTIVPLLLADYGYRIGYLDLFPEASVELKQTRGIRCVAMANVHQDETKMSLYQQQYSNQREQYFTDPALAVRWIACLPTF